MTSPFDYLTIGHISRDVVSLDLSPSGYSTGGTVSFSAEMAHALGCRASVLTSAADDIDAAAAIPNATVHVVPSPNTTSFSNIYKPEGRTQIVHNLAGWVTATDVPATWRDTPIVHLGPITNMIDANLVYAFPGSIVGITPQGWMREWGDDGLVKQIPLQHADILLPNAHAVIIGEEDLQDAAELAMMREKSRLLVMTRSARGCIIFAGDEVYDVPAPQVVELNATGAGDIFATAFFVRLWRSQHNILDSAEFANRIASASVTQPDLAAKVKIVNEMMEE